LPCLPRHPLRRAAAAAASTLIFIAITSGCGGSSGVGTTSGGSLEVVAAENFWGSIAAQLAGSKATVRSVITSPSTDPHDYEPTATDARTMAGAKLAIVNGIGYDGWASRLLAANPVSGRVVLDVGDLLGLHNGDNPHQWYSPPSTARVIAAISAGLTKLDPADAAYFAARRKAFDTVSLARYNRLRAEIRRRFAGVPVGYSESIFAPLGQDVGLRLLTPAGFPKAIAEGTDVSAADKAAVDRQVADRRVAVWIYNSQNLTPDVQRVNALARAAHVPVVTITETLTPASATYEQWQAAQLSRLLDALHRATGR
jgi:zinc/manganese transport system substrate-binding protein